MIMRAGAKVVDGKIIVIDGSNEERITIKAREHIDLFINDKLCETDKIYEITSFDKITYNCEKIQSKRETNVIISEDKMKAYITVEYTPEVEYKLKDRGLFLNLALTTEIVSEKQPEHFTILELHKVLKNLGVVHGIKDENLEIASKGCENEILAAEGDEPINDTPSELKLFFTPTQMMFPEPDSKEKIDYKNLFRISNVNVGDKIAKIIPEVMGKDGMNVLGQIVKREYIRKIPINVSNGCRVENDDVIATIDGKAHVVNRSISVNRVYTVETVDMKTCNIKFYGDIEVYNNVEDNMSVSAGGSLDVSHNVNTSDVVTGGEITILGNAFNSKILCGQIDIRKKEYADLLIAYKDVILKIIDIINELNIKRLNINMGELIKNITEKKFQDFQKMSLNIVSTNIKNKVKRNRLVDFIKDKILGYNILQIKSINDLTDFIDILDNEIDYYDKNIIVPLDIRISYCQDCEIKSTGNIIIGGKGEYTSNLNAMKDILFTRADSVARGGTLTAGGDITVGIVGSKAYVPTILRVPKYGKINAALAYKNTIFCFGNLTMVLEETRKNINVYFDKNTRKIEIVKSGL